MSEPFWQKNSLATHIFFDLCLLKPFCPVANFEQQSICIHNDNPVDMACAHVISNAPKYWCSLCIFWDKINGEFLKDSTGVNVRSLTKTKQMSYF